MLSIFDFEKDEEKNKNSENSKKNNIGFAFEDESDEDILSNTNLEKPNVEDSLKSDSLNFSSLVNLIDEPDSINEMNSSFPSQNTNNFLLNVPDNSNNNDNYDNNNKNYTSALKVPILKTYSSKKTKKLPFFFEDEDEKDSDDEIESESKNFTFYGKSKFNKDNLNINTAYSFPKRKIFDEKLLNANINDFIRKEDILGEKEGKSSNKNEMLKDNNDYGNLFDTYQNDINILNENIEEDQKEIEDTQVKNHIIKAIEEIKNNDNEISNLTELTQNSDATQNLEFESIQSLGSTQILTQNGSNKMDTLKSSQLDINIFDFKNSQNDSLEKEKESETLTNELRSEITKTVFDDDKELAQSVLDITEKYKNHVIQNKLESEDVIIENTNELDYKENIEIDNTESDSSDEDYDFSKKFERNTDKVEKKEEKIIEDEKILSFEEWKKEYFSNSGLDTENMNEEMMMTIYENWKNKKYINKSEKIKEKKKKDKLNKSDIENIRKETDRLTRSSFIELPVKKTKKVTMKNFLAKYSKKNDDNNEKKTNSEIMDIEQDIITNTTSSNKDTEAKATNVNVKDLSKNKSLILNNFNKNIQIEFDDSDSEDDDMIIEIEKPINHSNNLKEDEAKYKTIINLNQQDKNDTLSHSQLIKQLWNKTEQQAKIEREKLEKIHKKKLERQALQKEKEQAEILDEQEKEKVLKELDEEDLEVIDKELLKKLNDKNGKKELKRLKKLTFQEIEEYQKKKEDEEIKNKMIKENSVMETNNLNSTSITVSNEIKEFKYGSAEDSDGLAEFFQASNTDTNTNNKDDINIWDKLRQGSPIMSGQSEIWSGITETAVINKSGVSTFVPTTTYKNDEESMEMNKESGVTISSFNLTKTLNLEDFNTDKSNNDDFEKLVDINGSDEVNIVPQSSLIKENTQLLYNSNSDNNSNNGSNNNSNNKINNIITQTKIKNNKKEVINIIQNSSKKPNLLMSWLNKGSTKEINKKNRNLEKEKINSLEQKHNDTWDNYDNNLIQSKKDEFEDSLRDLSLDDQNYLINNNIVINEKDDEYTVENLDDNIDNYLSDDSFDLSNMLPTQNETNSNSQIRNIPKVEEEEEDDDDDINVIIPRIKNKKNKTEKSIYLEDEAVESEDEELKNLGIFKDKEQEDDDDADESDSNIVYSGDEDEINTNDIDKILELHRKKMKDEDEKNMSIIINGVTTGNFRKRKRLNDEELEKGYDLSDDDLDIHGLRSLRRFVDRVDPHSHKHKHYKHKGALAIYASKIETAPFAKCFEINTDDIEIMEETNNFSDFERETQEVEDEEENENENENEIIIDEDDNDKDEGEIEQLNKEIEELKDDHDLMDGDFTKTLTIKKFEPSRITRKESSFLKEIEENMNEETLKRASSANTVDDFLNTSNINHDFDILKYINKSTTTNNVNITNKLFEEPDIIDPFLVNYKRKAPRAGSLLNKKEEELDRLRKFDSNLELNLGSSRKNVIGGMFSSNSLPLGSDMNIPLSSKNNNEIVKIKEKSNSINSSRSSIRPIGLLRTLSEIDSNIN